MQKSIKYLEATIKILIIISILLVFIYSATDIMSNVMNVKCFGIVIHDFIPYFPIILAFFLEIIVVLLRKRNNLEIKNSVKIFFKFLAYFIVAWLIVGFLFVSLCACSSRSKARDARRQSDLRQISAAQEMFYGENLKYADSQKELVKYFPEPIKDPITGKEYTDADGFGLEGGDNNPITWSVQTILEGNFIPEVCLKNEKQPGKIYYCNETGCGIKNQ